MENEEIKDEEIDTIDVDVKKTVNIENNNKINMYLIFRYIQMFCIGAFVFGALWSGTETFNLTTAQFMMLYGGSGALISEIIARIFKKKM